MQLYATPLSHFSRKVRLLLDHYELDYEFVHVGNVADAKPATFHGNPVMKVPVLVDDGRWLIESDHIAAYIVRKHDPEDRYRVLATDADTLNLRAVLNAMMAEEVKLILAERTGLATSPHAFFAKAREAIGNGLAWLNDRAEQFNPANPGYREFHLVCLWDHLRHYELFPLDYPRLAAIATELGEHARVDYSSPARSLERCGNR